MKKIILLITILTICNYAYLRKGYHVITGSTIKHLENNINNISGEYEFIGGISFINGKYNQAIIITKDSVSLINERDLKNSLLRYRNHDENYERASRFR